MVRILSQMRESTTTKKVIESNVGNSYTLCKYKRNKIQQQQASKIREKKELGNAEEVVETKKKKKRVEKRRGN